MTTSVFPHRKVLASVAFLAGTVMFSATAFAGGLPATGPGRPVTTDALPPSAVSRVPVRPDHGGPGPRWLIGPGGRWLVGPPAGVAAMSIARPLPASTNPRASVAPRAAFVSACFTAAMTTSGCNAAALAAVDAARAAEGYGPLGLPAHYKSMTLGNQLLIVANAERTSRGLPKFTEVASLDLLALAGAQANTDPTGPNDSTWNANIAWGYPTALTADFAWMYDDGPGSPNVDCTHAGAAGCWAHRQNILAPWSGQAGAAAVPTSEGWVLTELFVERP